MDQFATAFLAQHPQLAGALAIAAGAVLAWTVPASFLARWIRRPDGSATWWKRAAYDVFVDTPAWVAALEANGILGGIINLPGVPSRSPVENPTPTTSAAIRARRAQADAMVPSTGSIEETTRARKDSGRIPFWLFIGALGWGVAMAGCGTAGGQALGNCEIGQLSSDGQIAVTTVQDIADNQGSTQTDLENAGLKLLPGQLACAAQALLAWWNSSTKGEPTPQRAHGQQLLQAYLARHPANACGPSYRNEVRYQAEVRGRTRDLALASSSAPASEQP